MAKVKYTIQMHQTYLESLYSGTFGITRESRKEAQILDLVTTSSIDIDGEKLTGGVAGLTGGTIHKLTFFNAGDEKLITVKGDFKAEKISDAAEQGFEPLMKAIFGGKDTFKGSSADEALLGYGGKDKIFGGAGNDVLEGGRGNKDVLVGGKGDDVFRFNLGDGHDIVRDFDVTGSLEEGHDFLWLTSDHTIRKNGKGDAVIVLSEVDTLTLQGISKNELEDYHFLMAM